jgi:methanogenic corrinoid protein MtbC1
MIVGTPVSQDYAEHIGADGCAQSAPSAVEKAKQFMELAFP